MAMSTPNSAPTRVPKRPASAPRNGSELAVSAMPATVRSWPQAQSAAVGGVGRAITLQPSAAIVHKATIPTPVRKALTPEGSRNTTFDMPSSPLFRASPLAQDTDEKPGVLGK